MNSNTSIYIPRIDTEKTALLRSIIFNFPAITAQIRRENSIDIDCSLTQCSKAHIAVASCFAIEHTLKSEAIVGRAIKASIYGYKNPNKMDTFYGDPWHRLMERGVKVKFT